MSSHAGLSHQEVRCRMDVTAVEWCSQGIFEHLGVSRIQDPAHEHSWLVQEGRKRKVLLAKIWG